MRRILVELVTISRLLDGKAGLVTGAGSGIGFATSMLMAREGARAIALVDANEEAARAAAASLQDSGVEALALRCDISNAEEVESVLATTIERFGRLDCAVNSAGITGPSRPLRDYSDAEWNLVIDVNLSGLFYCLRAELRRMTRGGAIVNISSGTIMNPLPGLAPYVATKAGALHLTRAVAGECVADGIRINAVLPGPTRTPMFVGQFHGDARLEQDFAARSPMKRLGEPLEIAEAVVWLCSDRASFAHGMSMLVDGGRHAFAQ